MGDGSFSSLFSQTVRKMSPSVNLYRNTGNRTGLHSVPIFHLVSRKRKPKVCAAFFLFPWGTTDPKKVFQWNKQIQTETFKVQKQQLTNSSELPDNFLKEIKAWSVEMIEWAWHIQALSPAWIVTLKCFNRLCCGVRLCVCVCVFLSVMNVGWSGNNVARWSP